MRKIGVFGLTMVAVWVLATSPGQLVYSFLFIGSAISGGVSRRAALLGTLIGSLPFLLTLGVGLVLLVRRHRIAQRLFDDDESTGSSLEPTVAFRVGVALLGVYLVVTGATGIVLGAATRIDTLLQMPSYGAAGSMVVRQQLLQLIPDIIAQLLRLALGAALVLKAERIVEWIMERQERTPNKRVEPTPSALD
jgi:hypothetical protein